MKHITRANNISSIDEDINAVNVFIQNVIEKDNLSFSEVISRLKAQRQEKLLEVPSSILKIRELGILEAITKYLKEELNLKYNEIAPLLNRDARSIWISYDKAKTKHPKKFVKERSSTPIPLNIFSNRNLGLLENLTIYLRDELNLKNREVGSLLARDNRTIWASYNRAKKRNNETNQTK